MFYAEEGDRAGVSTPPGDTDVDRSRPVHINGVAVAAKVITVADWVKEYGECHDSTLYAWVWTNPATAAATVPPPVLRRHSLRQAKIAAHPSGSAMEAVTAPAAVTATA